jgi:hypothetical protein
MKPAGAIERKRFAPANYACIKPPPPIMKTRADAATGAQAQFSAVSERAPTTADSVTPALTEPSGRS